MGKTIVSDFSDPDNLLGRAGIGDQEAVAALFAIHRERLKQMVRVCDMDRRLQGRIGTSDVLQGDLHSKEAATARR